MERPTATRVVHFVPKTTLSQISDIYRSAFKPGLRESAGTLRSRLRRGVYIVYLLETGEREVLGFLLMFSRMDTAHIDYLAVSQKHQGKGYCSQLLKDVLTHANDNGVVTTLECEHHLVGYYSKFGFVLIPSNYTFLSHPLHLMAYVPPGEQLPASPSKLITRLLKTLEWVTFVVCTKPDFSIRLIGEARLLLYDASYLRDVWSERKKPP